MTPRSSAPLPADRRALVHNHRDIPGDVAGGFVRRWREMKDDIVSLANGALVEAGRTYDPDRGVPFRTYAVWRVWCELRSWATQEVVRRHPALAAVHQVEQSELDGRLHEPADGDAIERALRDTEEQAKERAIAFGRSSVTHKSIAFLLRAELLRQASPRGGEAAMIARQEYAHGFARLADALPTLTDEQRRILVTHYAEGRSLRQIARTDGLALKTAQKLHAAALAQLKSELRKQGVTGAPPIEGRPSGFELGLGCVLTAGEPDAPATRAS